MTKSSGKRPKTVVLEVMRVNEIETSDRMIKRTWSYEKKNSLMESVQSPAPRVKDCVESEVNLLKDNSYTSKNSSPLAHRIKQNRIDQREKLHLN